LRKKIRNIKNIGRIRIRGKNNRIIIIEEDGKECVNCFLRMIAIKGLKINVEGSNNTIRIFLPTKIDTLTITICPDAGNTLVEIGANIRGSLSIFFRNGIEQSVRIGNNTGFGGVGINSVFDNSNCVIGNNCMFSHSIVVWVSDTHPIFNKNTGESLTTSGNVVIGDHCWIGENVRITKRAIIPNNTIVGVSSVVTKTFTEEYTAIAGNPAKVVRTGITWDE
jgi:acetyltransferase-like isoleucine patch superfamily enzyme